MHRPASVLDLAGVPRTGFLRFERQGPCKLHCYRTLATRHQSRTCDVAATASVNFSVHVFKAVSILLLETASLAYVLTLNKTLQLFKV